MLCYRGDDCGPFEMYNCNTCPSSRPEYIGKNEEDKKPKRVGYGCFDD